ncbi:MAG: Holliday junction branch migration protein RuvA [Magnetospirillum sp. WYHS-4]
MIGKLKGVVDSVGEDQMILDVGGVGYLVFCSGRTLGRLAPGEAVALQIETQVREDRIALYGFRDVAERDWFRLLLTVQGVGSKVALAILSALSVDQLVQAVAAQDKKALGLASGVGPKLAARIVSELKDKTGGIALGPAAFGGPAPASAAPLGLAPALADAVSALVNLGYGRSEALGAAARASTKLGGEASVEALIKGGLAELMQGSGR